MALSDYLNGVSPNDPSVVLFARSLDEVANMADNQLSSYVNKNGESFLVERSRAAEFNDMVFAITDLYERIDGPRFFASKYAADEAAGSFWKLLESVCVATMNRKREYKFVLQMDMVRFKQIADYLFEHYILVSKYLRPELDLAKEQVELMLKLFSYANNSIIVNNECYDDFKQSMQTRFGLDTDKCKYLWAIFTTNKKELQNSVVVDFISDFLSMISTQAEIDVAEDE